MNQEKIQKIIEAGNLAPSGGNSQPWKFRVKENIIEVIALPEKDHPVLNFNNRGTYIAHGALLENMKIAAEYLGYNLHFQILLTKNEQNELISFKINIQESFEKKENEEISKLYKAIFERHSNRKPYQKNGLSEEYKKYLFSELNNFTNCKTILLEKEKINEIASHLPVDILVNLSNSYLHKLMFKEILWNEEDQKTKGGLYIKTMEVPPPAVGLFKLLSNWKIANFFNKIGLIKNIYRQSIKTVVNSSLIVAFIVENNDQDFIEMGRLLENIWLRATVLNLSSQFICGNVFLWQQANLGDKKIFTPENIEVIDGFYQKLKQMLNLENNQIVAGFLRMGFSSKPTAISYKRPPLVELD